MSTFYIQITPYVVDELGALMPLKREHRIMVPDCKDVDEAVERLTSKARRRSLGAILPGRWPPAKSRPERLS